MPRRNWHVVRATRAPCLHTVGRVPRISSFYGVTIAMYYREHGFPHFHALYGEHKASVEIGSLELLGGYLPPRALRLVRQWASMHREELRESWNLAEQAEVLESIAPLP